MRHLTQLFLDECTVHPSWYIWLWGRRNTWINPVCPFSLSELLVYVWERLIGVRRRVDCHFMEGVISGTGTVAFGRKEKTLKLRPPCVGSLSDRAPTIPWRQCGRQPPLLGFPPAGGFVPQPQGQVFRFHLCYVPLARTRYWEWKRFLPSLDSLCVRKTFAELPRKLVSKLWKKNPRKCMESLGTSSSRRVGLYKWRINLLK